MPAYPKPVQAKIYIKALEDRVAELETLLKNGGDRSVSRDHWAGATGGLDDADSPSQDDIQPLVNAVRDLSLDVAGSYIGGASMITLGRVLGTALAGRPLLTLPATSPEDMNAGQAASIDSHHSYLGSGGFSLISQMSKEMADAMVHAYLKHTRTNFPIIFSFEVLDLHKRRHDLNDVYEESILQLIYGLGGHFLEKTCESKQSYDAEQYYFAALEERDTILRLGDTRALTYLLLLGQHNAKRTWSLLPLDVDEDTQDLEILCKATEQDRSIPPSPPTSMSTLIHLLRLKRIESEIQHTIYRVDRMEASQDICIQTNTFIDKLHAWKNAIPQQKLHQEMMENQVYLSYDSYMAAYYKAFRTLLQPRLYEKNIPERYLELCAEACRGVCQTYKRLHTKLPIAFTSLSLQSVFLAGLTLIYCMWIDTTNSRAFNNHGALTDCSIMLYVMAERWQVGRKYRDLFELVKKSVLETIEEGQHAPRSAVPSLKNGMQTSLQQLQANTVVENVADDLEQMISDMTGEPVSAWHDETSFSWTLDETSTIFDQVEWEPS
ncbi:hypothetical protein S40285_04420 [Stachybotrys chlorohalonatus IBT 40285]|uniref:Transcription factor domain-containing protein n=1 Tax=Stachybotrys chlorohalonatus (strain IBT 40285) TaxID=1283841 RepID=A0A084R1V9_STAC4|nr:hypothetical protein S40285_04420 [Stachybotrys chlorohalonata IBT 40285]